jgi:hypothetical protein
VLQNTFPSVKFETCVVVTNKGVYQIELRDRPHIIFLELADKEMWANCEDFCKTFNLSLPQCIEFAGDIFLKKKKITQALMTYNIARVNEKFDFSTFRNISHFSVLSDPTNENSSQIGDVQ